MFLPKVHVIHITYIKYFKYMCLKYMQCMFSNLCLFNLMYVSETHSTSTYTYVILVICVSL